MSELLSITALTEQVITSIYELDKDLTTSTHELFTIAWTLGEFPESKEPGVEPDDIGYSQASFPVSFASFDKDHCSHMSMTWQTAASICTWMRDTDWASRDQAGTAPTMNFAVESMKFLLLKHRQRLYWMLSAEEGLQQRVDIDLLKELQIRLRSIADMFKLVDNDTAEIFGING